MVLYIRRGRLQQVVNQGGETPTILLLFLLDIDFVLHHFDSWIVSFKEQHDRWQHILSVGETAGFKTWRSRFQANLQKQ